MHLYLYKNNISKILYMQLYYFLYESVPTACVFQHHFHETKIFNAKKYKNTNQRWLVDDLNAAPALAINEQRCESNINLSTLILISQLN